MSEDRWETSARISELIDDAFNESNHHQRARLYRQALALAYQHGDEELTQRAAFMFALMNSSLGYAEEAMRAYLPHVKEHQIVNQMFGADRYEVWPYIKVVEHLPEFPGINAERIERYVANLSERVQERFSWRLAEWNTRLQIANTMGDAVSARRWLDLREREDRELARKAKPFEDNQELAMETGSPICGARSRQMAIETLLLEGEYEAAFEKLERLRTMAGSCMNICRSAPHRIFGLILRPLRENGKLDLAEEIHQRGVAIVQGNGGQLRAVGEHIQHLAVTDRPEAAAKLFHDHLAISFTSATPYHQFHFLAHALPLGETAFNQVALEALPREIRRPFTAPAALQSWAEERVQLLARQFDARNGNAMFADVLNR
tara:strand:+ start:5425 stop:6552 length:1128 start_codon:yes stop_codon:yes gene_type:complete